MEIERQGQTGRDRALETDCQEQSDKDREILRHIDDDSLTNTRRQTDTSMHHWLLGLVEK